MPTILHAAAKCVQPVRAWIANAQSAEALAQLVRATSHGARRTGWTQCAIVIALVNAAAEDCGVAAISPIAWDISRSVQANAERFGAAVYAPTDRQLATVAQIVFDLRSWMCA